MATCYYCNGPTSEATRVCLECATEEQIFRRAPLPEQKDMAAHDEIFLLALEQGCSPEWYDGILGWSWHCGCPLNLHGCDQQCSALTKASLTPITNVP